MPQLGLGQVVLVLGAVGVIVGWVAVDKAVEHDRVEGHPPVGGRWVEAMFLPFARVVEGIGGSNIGVEIPGELLRVILEGDSYRYEE